ncbi:MAG: hypothetical protein LBR07_03620 [Puniceicoccales bacterium]|jgi:hypothetical protein|nr:hypothetical protein [Puniceicoccales bacterium]
MSLSRFLAAGVVAAAVVGFGLDISAAGGAGGGGGGDFATVAALERGFKTPPAEARPHVWWHWMDGNVSKEGITADLEAMASAGVGGAQIFNVGQSIPEGKARFGSPAWFGMIGHAHKEARRLGIELCIHNCAGWANSGGPWNTPENAMKFVETAKSRVRGPATFTLPAASADGVFTLVSDSAARTATPLPAQKPRKGFYEDIAVVAFPTPAAGAEIPNFEKKIFRLRGGTGGVAPDVAGSAIAPAQVRVLWRAENASALPASATGATFSLPAGDWTVLRVGYASHGRTNHPAPAGGLGLEVDKLSRAAVRAHWDGHMAKVLDAARAAAPLDPSRRGGLNNVLIDSYEVGTQNWTRGFEREFARRRGYDITPFLPVLAGAVVGSPEITERFLWDFRRVIADVFAEVYSGFFGEIARANGLLYSIEPYGNCPTDDLQYGSFADVPMAEFWQSGGHCHNVDNAKLGASIGHVNGRKFIGAEAFTASPHGGRWQKDAFALKPQNDAALCAGINRMIYHRYAHQPWVAPARLPGMTMGQWGTHFERTLTWWKQAGEWLAYQTRCQFLLQQGRFAADVLFFAGEDAPNGGDAGALPPKGYDYDVCDTAALARLTVTGDGKLVLAPAGITYRVLVLRTGDAMSPAVLAQLKRLAAAGAKIIGPKPRRAQGLANYPAADAAVRAGADALWGEGRGKISPTQDAAAALRELGVAPDFASNDAAAQLRHIHRIAADGADIYFIASSNHAGANAEVTLRTAGGVPELWHPDTGAIEPAPVWRSEKGAGAGNDTTTLPLRLGPCGSVFVVFRKNAGAGDAGDAAAAPHITAASFREFAAGGAAAGTVRDLQIHAAHYGAFPDSTPERARDVTRALNKLLAEGKRSIKANNALAGEDPASGVVKEFWAHLVDADGSNARTVRLKEGATLEIAGTTGGKPPRALKAVYGAFDGVEPTAGVATRDVTAKIAGAVRDGQIDFPIENHLLGGDPLPRATKELRVTYSLEGRTTTAVVREHGRLRLPPVTGGAVGETPAYELRAGCGGENAATGAVAGGVGVPRLLAWRAGAFSATLSNGATLTRTVAAVPAPVVIGGPWQLTFPPNWGAPAAVKLDKLISWTDHPDAGVRYFSGTGTYTTSFTLPPHSPTAPHSLILDLGDLKNFAEVALNGHEFPVLWKPPFRLDVTRHLRRGVNTLVIKITNLWPNRLIGDEQLPADAEYRGKHLARWPRWFLDGKPSPTGRHTFTTWRHFNAGDKPLPSGLFGPVKLHTVITVPLQ